MYSLIYVVYHNLIVSNSTYFLNLLFWFQLPAKTDALMRATTDVLIIYRMSKKKKKELEYILE